MLRSPQPTSRVNGALHRALLGATLALTGCGGANVPSPALPVIPPTAGQDDAVYIVAAHVNDDWLGGRWDGAPARLAVSASPRAAVCAAHSTSRSTEHATTRADGLPDAQHNGSAFERIDRDAELIAPQAGDAPNVAVFVAEWDHAGACQGVGEWHVDRVGRGAWMAWSGASDATDPGAVLASGGALVGASGWTVEGGVWRPGQEVVVAEVRRPPAASSQTACAEFDGVDRAEGLANALLYDRIASPGPQARIARVLGEYRSQIGGAAGALLDADSAAAASTDPATASADTACAASPVWQVAALSAGVWSPQSPQAMEAWGPSSHALAAYVALEFDALELAQQHLDRALSRSPSASLPRYVSGLLASERALPASQVAGEFERAVDDPMLNSAASYTLGLLAEGTYAMDEAAMWFERSAGADSQFAPPVNALGFLAFEAGDFAQARGFFEEALARDPGHVGACNNLGYIAERVDGDPIAAEHWYRRALEIAPDSVAALFNLASVQERWTGELEQARLNYSEALRISPGYTEASEALSALEARPNAGLDTLTGTWNGTRDDGSTLLASFTPDGVTFVARSMDGTATTERLDATIAWLRGPQLALQTHNGERVIEMLAADVIEVYDATHPTERTRLTRRTGAGVAMLSFTSDAF